LAVYSSKALLTTQQTIWYKKRKLFLYDEKSKYLKEIGCLPPDYMVLWMAVMCEDAGSTCPRNFGNQLQDYLPS